MRKLGINYLLLIVFYTATAQQEVQVNSGYQNPKDTFSNHGKKLEEVVVTALGLKREQKSLGYSVTQIGGDEVNAVKDANFVNSLSGKVAGLSVQASNALGGSSNVILRGYKSITGNNQALFVVDGVPINNDNNSAAAVTGNPGSTTIATGAGGYDFGNAAMDINPDDIESMSILKGAAASALYGSRAANGVIMITTKKSKTQQGIGIFYNVGYQAGLVNPQTLPKYQRQYGGGNGASYSIYDPQKGIYSGNYDPNVDIYPGIGAYGSPNWQGYFFNYGNGPAGGSGQRAPYVPYQDDASMGAAFNPNLKVYQWSAWIPESPNYGIPTAWVFPQHSIDYFFQLSNTINNNVGFEGKNDKGGFRMSYTNLYQTGYLPNNNLKKNTVNLFGTYNLLPNFTISALVNYVNTSSLGNSYSGSSTNNSLFTFRQWNQTNADLKELKDIYFATGKNYGWNLRYDPSTSSLTPPAYQNNPYFLAYENAPTMNEDRFFGNIQLQYKVLPWLTALGRIGYDIYSQLIQTYKAVGTRPGSTPPYYARYNNNFKEFNYDAYLQANKDWGRFDLNAVLGTNIRVDNQNTIFASTTGGLITPGFYALSNSLSPLSPPVELALQKIVYGYYASVSMGWDDYLYLDLSGRVDQSSTLPKANNTYFYPSASLSFVFSKFLSPVVPWISFGKVRVNYAQVGSDAPFAVLKNYYTPNYSSSGQSTAANPLFGTLPLSSTNTTNFNPNLKPESTESYEVGLEMQFLNNRIGFDIDYYHSNTFNQILPLSVSSGTGYFYNYINGGQIRNQGIELSINATPVKLKNFSWRTAVNWYKNWNMVVSLYTDASGKQVTNYQLGSFPVGSLNATVGRPYGDIWGTDFVYAPDGQKIVDADGYYLKTPSSNNVIGNIIPNFKGGWMNTFTYQNFSFSFLIDYQVGGNVLSVDLANGLSTGLYPETAGNNDLGNPLRSEVIQQKNADGTWTSNPQSGGLILPGVVKNADGSYSPNTFRVDAGNKRGFFVGGNQNSPNKAFVYDASYVKLREVTITYTIPQLYLQRQRFVKSCSVSLTGKNLWIIYKNLPYSDPEALTMSGNIQGVQAGALPSLIQFGAKVNITF